MTRNGGGFFASILPSGSFNLDAYGPGTYVMTVTATDADNDRLGDSLTTITTRTVIVTDDDESPPVLALGGSSGTQTDAETQVFTWNISDASRPCRKRGADAPKRRWHVWRHLAF